MYQVGCHHCRGPQPLPSEIQKKLIEFKSGLIVVFLEKMYSKLVQELAQLIPGGRDGQAILWNVKDANLENIPENLFVYENIDRQDIVGKQLFKNVYFQVVFICIFSFMIFLFCLEK